MKKVKEIKKITPEEFLEKELKELVINCPKIKVLYEFNEELNAHCIEITPSDIYCRDDDYNFCEIKITHEFYKNYNGKEEIYFFGKNTYNIMIKDPIFEFKGDQYVE